jgi:hypothetical protein
LRADFAEVDQFGVNLILKRPGLFPEICKKSEKIPQRHFPIPTEEPRSDLTVGRRILNEPSQMDDGQVDIDICCMEIYNGKSVRSI